MAKPGKKRHGAAYAAISLGSLGSLSVR